MKKDEDVFKQFRDSFSRMDGHFYILEQRIPVELQMEYFKYSEDKRKNAEENTPLTDEEGDEIYALLEKPEITVEEKKDLLTTLAISKSVKAHRLLTKYADRAEDTVADWAHMALMESRISLESEFSDEKQIYISTGLGGKEEKLRFYVLLISRNNYPFEEYQRQIIEREFPYMLSHEDWDIERLTIEEQYVEIVFLIPIRADIKGVLDKVIGECNQYGDFLSGSYTITNVKELSKEEIADLITKNGDI